MRTRSSGGVCATVFAALTIIGCCLTAMRSEKRRTTSQKQMDEAVQNWEGEGGAIVAADEDQDVETARA